MFDQRLGVRGQPESIARIDDVLYLSTRLGLYQLRQSQASPLPASFQPLFEREVTTSSVQMAQIGRAHWRLHPLPMNSAAAWIIGTTIERTQSESADADDYPLAPAAAAPTAR